MTKGKLIIRSATLDDIDHLAELWWESAHYHAELETRFQYATNAHKAHREFMVKQIQSDNALFGVAQIGDDLVGYIGAMTFERPPIHIHRRTGHIEGLYVKPELRGNGIGTGLWQFAYDWLKEKEVPTINLWVASQNPKALEFWKEFNFSEIMIRLELKTS